MREIIELKTVGEICDPSYKFLVENYQRGYRWGHTQVSELLEDFQFFFNELKKSPHDGDYYCLQPVVVKRVGDVYEVVDGQQRLTTLHILLQCLGCTDLYSIDYVTRKGSASFLRELQSKKADSEEVVSNPDYYYFVKARDTIAAWLKTNLTSEFECRCFAEKVRQNVKFIWYDAQNESAIDIFTRLNIGKIGLTSAELIKAMLLNRVNFFEGADENDSYSERLIDSQQIEIASQWDAIERKLQNDEFWMFFHGKNYEKATRIDYLFDLITEARTLGEPTVDIGNDEYSSFRYVYDRFCGDVNVLWGHVKENFAILEEWYCNLLYYHYVGYLLAGDNRPTVSDLMKLWRQNNKRAFLEEIKRMIRVRIDPISEDLEKVYDKVGGASKTACRPLLLFHNVMTYVMQNYMLEGEIRYSLPAFSRFQFHLYKRENWDVEHIASNTDNPLVEFKDQRDWLTINLSSVRDERLKDDVTEFLDKGEKAATQNKFDDLKERVERELFGSAGKSQGKSLQGDDKSKIWNFALLDRGTNRSYGNSLFPAKRNFIIDRNRGLQQIWNADRKCWEDRPLPGAFVPVCTLKAFLKQYTRSSDVALLEWSKTDAAEYKNDMKRVIEFFNNSEVK